MEIGENFYVVNTQMEPLDDIVNLWKCVGKMKVKIGGFSESVKLGDHDVITDSNKLYNFLISMKLLQ